MTVFAITGTLSKPRNVIVSAIQNAGHTVATSLTKAVNYLVQGTSNRASDSAKLTKASERGIPIITEAQLYNMLSKKERVSRVATSPRRSVPVVASTSNYRQPAIRSPSNRKSGARNVVSLRVPNIQSSRYSVGASIPRSSSHQSAAVSPSPKKTATASRIVFGRPNGTAGSTRAVRAAQSALSALATLLSEGWYHDSGDWIRHKLSSAKRLIEASLREVGAKPAPTIFKISPKTAAILSLLQLAADGSSNAHKFWKEDLDSMRADNRHSQSADIEMDRLTIAVNDTQLAHNLIMEADRIFNPPRIDLPRLRTVL